jgi:hypothetical protein
MQVGLCALAFFIDHVTAPETIEPIGCGGFMWLTGF